MRTITNLEELEDAGELQLGDEVTFKMNGHELVYEVKHNHLTLKNLLIAQNQLIFYDLGMTDLEYLNFARNMYGYSDSSDPDDCWPTYRVDDYAAATRLVRAIYVEIETQKDQPCNRKDVRIIKSLKDLNEAGTLRYGDEVVFCTDGHTLIYHVHEWFLNIKDRVFKTNDQIFYDLGMTEEEYLGFARNAYGYDDSSTSNNYWPEYREEDYEAATRLVRAIYEHIG